MTLKEESCYDASVRCKLLGVGADVYWDKDTTKYSEKSRLPSKQGIERLSPPLRRQQRANTWSGSPSGRQSRILGNAIR